MFFFKLENPDYQAKRSNFAFAGNICTVSSTGKRYIQWMYDKLCFISIFQESQKFYSMDQMSTQFI